MLCQACGALNSAERELCSRCGTKLMILSGAQDAESEASDEFFILYGHPFSPFHRYAEMCCASGITSTHSSFSISP